MLSGRGITETAGHKLNINTKITMENFISFLSEDRFKGYLDTLNPNESVAKESYLMNIRVSQKFYPLLSFVEIGLRNSINKQLIFYFTEDWYNNENLLKLLRDEERNRIKNAIQRLNEKGSQIRAGKVVAELTFGFWSSLFDKHYNSSLWGKLKLTFPFMPKVISKRNEVSPRINKKYGNLEIEYSIMNQSRKIKNTF